MWQKGVWQKGVWGVGPKINTSEGLHLDSLIVRNPLLFVCLFVSVSFVLPNNVMCPKMSQYTVFENDQACRKERKAELSKLDK